MSLRILAFVAVLSIAVAPAQAAPVHYAANSTATLVDDGAFFIWRLSPSVFEVTKIADAIDFTLDTANADVWTLTLNSLTVTGPSGVVFTAPSETVQLAINPALDTFWWRATTATSEYQFHFKEGEPGWRLTYYALPNPVVDVALLPEFPGLKPWTMRAVSIEAPEPAAWLLAVMPLALVFRRRQRLA